jgi:hypothetical protein
MSQHISRSTSNRTALVPQKKQHDPLEFPDRTVFIRREKQEDFPEMKFITGKAYGVYKQNGKQNGRLITLYGGDPSHAFEGASSDGYLPQWMH